MWVGSPVGKVADRWGEALLELKEKYRLPPLEAFSFGLQVELIGVVEGLREDVAALGNHLGQNGTGVASKKVSTPKRKVEKIGAVPVVTAPKRTRRTQAV